MVKKSGNFFEQHVEKIVLGLSGAVCLWLLVAHVLVSPKFEYEKQKYSVNEIDESIKKQALQLNAKISEKPVQENKEYKSVYKEFAGKFNDVLSGISAQISIPQPSFSNRNPIDDRIYGVPVPGGVDKAAAEHIRAAVYMPTEDLNDDKTYDDTEHEVIDKDIVTVQGEINIAELYNRFYQNYAGEEVKKEWRDPCLAKPIFAAVELDRQEELPDGTWSSWQPVPRSKIDSQSKMFEVAENVAGLPAGGMQVRLFQFDKMDVQKSLLQPETYQIASQEEEWYPPLMHKDFLKQEKEITTEERRQAITEEKEKKRAEREKLQANRESKRTAAKTVKSSPGAAMDPMMGMPLPGMGGPAGMKPKSIFAKKPIEKSVIEKKPEKRIDFDSKFKEVLISNETNYAKMKEPLLFWAHDDTVEPGKSYRYKIRYGVFNVKAGKGQFEEKDKKFKDQVVLWSEPSKPTDVIEIPEMLYIFPNQPIKIANKTGIVTIAKYASGYWYMHDFPVEPGELIGKAVPPELPKKKDKDKDKDKENVQPSEAESEVKLPELIDFSSGAVVVDFVAVNDWEGKSKMRPRTYYEMLYSHDGAGIERISVQSQYWSQDMQTNFNQIKELSEMPRQALREWGGQRTFRQGMPGKGSPEDMQKMMLDMMMMPMMQMQNQRR